MESGRIVLRMLLAAILAGVLLAAGDLLDNGPMRAVGMIAAPAIAGALVPLRKPAIDRHAAAATASVTLLLVAELSMWRQRNTMEEGDLTFFMLLFWPFFAVVTYPISYGISTATIALRRRLSKLSTTQSG